MNGSFSYCFEQIAQQISFRSHLNSIPLKTPVPVRLLVWPQSETIMMFRRKYDIFCTGSFKNLCPLIRIEQFGFEIISQVIISTIAKLCFVKFHRGGIISQQSMLIPFSIISFGGEAGNCVHTPMNKYAKLCLFEPLRYGTLVK